MEESKKSNLTKIVFIIIFIWCFLALIFIFTDLKISETVVNENSRWGIFGEVFGEIPGYGLIAIALSVLIGSYNKDIKKQKFAAYVIIIIGIVLLVLGLIFMSQDLINDGAVIAISLIFFLGFSHNKDWEAYRKISLIIVILAIINPLLFVQLTKIFWGRVRFRDLSPGFINYTSWFVPRGITGNDSFPSGHTAMACMFLPLMITLKKGAYRQPFKIIGTILIIGWALFVGLSRIVIGAHYASDVLFSAGMASISTILLYKKVYANNNNFQKD